MALDRHIKHAVYIFVIALVMRMGALALTFHGNEDVTPFDDAKIAANIVQGKGYSINLEYKNWLFYTLFLKEKQLIAPLPEGTKPTATKQPIYPLVLALFFTVFGLNQFVPVFIFQAIAASLVCGILVVMLQKVSQRAALIAGLATAIYPPFIYHSVTAPESTHLFMLLVAVFILTVTKIRENPSTSKWLICGLVAGLMILTEPVGLPFAVLSVGYLALFSPGGLRAHAKGVLQAVAVCILVFSPWLARNYIVFDRFPVIKGSVGLIINFGLQESGNGTWISEDKLVELEYLGRSRTELEEDDAIKQELSRLFPLHWREYVTSNVPQNFMHFVWEIRDYEHNRSASYLLGRRFPYIIIALFALPVFFKLAWQVVRSPSVRHSTPMPLICAVILVLTFTGIYAAFGAYHSRYRFPVELMFIVFFAQSVSYLLAPVWNKVLPLPSEASR